MGQGEPTDQGIAATAYDAESAIQAGRQGDEEGAAAEAAHREECKKMSDEELVQIVMERRVQEQVAKQAKAAVSAASGSASGNGSASSGQQAATTPRQ